MNRERYANREIETIEKETLAEIQKEYNKALKEMQKKFLDATKKFAKQDKEKKKLVEKGELKEKDYLAWRKTQLMTTSWMRDMVQQLAERCTEVTEKTAEIINTQLPDAYASGANHSQYEIETGLNINTNFTLHDASAVLAAMTVPLYPTVNVKKNKDINWNKKNIRSAITQGIMQGESVNEIAKRLQKATNAGAGVARRMARTMVGAAVEAGHQANGENIRDTLGIDIDKIWLATLDTRTRARHRQMDMERVPLDEPFSNKLMFPKDPDGDPAEVYNCRCDSVQLPKEVSLDLKDRFSRLPEGLSYEDWKAMKDKQKSNVVNGKDISATWERRADKFDFEIEDVINAQGYDGLPRIVDEDEFNEAVKRANGGKGFIAQRTYSAPNQEILDGYRNELYKGKWCVDCSIGGAQYGQGMYCASDYTGTLSDGIKEEMEHYQELGESRYTAKLSAERYKAIQNSKSLSEALRISNLTDKEFAKEFGHANKIPSSYTETITLDPSAKIVDYDKIEVEWSFSLDGTGDKYEDVGSYAAAKGYDAIVATSHGKSGSYSVILNRTKMIIKRSK